MYCTVCVVYYITIVRYEPLRQVTVKSIVPKPQTGANPARNIHMFRSHLTMFEQVTLKRKSWQWSHGSGTTDKKDL